jgi:hypothetical protein
MKILTSSHLTMAIAILVSICACSVGGEVVKITTVKEGYHAGLKKEDLAKIDEIKKTRGDKGIDESLRTVIEETRHFSVAQYLLQHPEARGPVGGDYRVGGYDVMSITVYEEKDLSREAVRVSADGRISFPLIGRINVDNLNIASVSWSSGLWKSLVAILFGPRSVF